VLPGTTSEYLLDAAAPEDGGGFAHLPFGAAGAADAGGDFEDLIVLATTLLNCPVGMVSVFQGESLRRVDGRGCDQTTLAGGTEMCRTLGPGNPVLMLADAAADARFRNSPEVAGKGGLRFYLGVCFIGSDGLPLGVLAVADTKPRGPESCPSLVHLDALARMATHLRERRRFERRSRIAEDIAQAAFSALVMFDASGRVTSTNPAAQAIFGPAVARGEPVEALFPAALQFDPAPVEGWLHTGIMEPDKAPWASRKLRARGADGELRKLEVTRRSWHADAPIAALILRDVTDRHESARRSRFDQQDPLTGLPNRAALLATTDALIVQGEPLGVALLGLNNFRATNDTLGHRIGDAVLQVVAFRLLVWLPDDAHLSHTEGDEFVLVFPRTSAAEVELLLNEMLRELVRPCAVDHQRIHLEASIGLVLHNTGEVDAEAGDCDIDARELLARAGLAMQHAAGANGPQLCRFQPRMRAAAIDRRALDIELRRASGEGEFELHYQPQIDLASGRPTGAEALLRWRHPERGLLLPVDFIDALSHSAVALSVGRWILERACRDAASWGEVGGRRLAVAVNLFPVQFSSSSLLDDVDRALALSGLAPSQLEIELTETIALIDDGVATQVLTQLRARGVRVAYDDFGTGFASLSMLQRLPVDRVKIDRSFVSNVMDNRGDETIVRSIVLIARNFDLQVTAEGVETPLQANFLLGLGCQHVQGWLYSKALAPTDFEGWLGAQAEAHRMPVRERDWANP